MQARKILTFVPVLAVLALLAGCGGKQPSGTTAAAGAKVTINGAGATFPYPIYSKWFQAYSKEHPDTTFNYQAVGSGAGIAQYQAGTVDFGATDVPLTDAEVKALPRPTLHIPTVAGAVVLAYNLPGVPTGLKLPGDVIADIFLGKVTTWNDPRLAAANPGVKLPATAVAVAHRSDGSGTTNIFTSYLSAVSPAWKQKVGAGKSVNWPVGTGGSGNPGVAGLIKNSPGTIGYVELAYADQNKLTYADVKNKAGNFVKATIDSTTAAANDFAPQMAKDVRLSIVNAPGANAYPIVGFTYLLIPQKPEDPAKGKALVDFLGWAMDAGQKMAPDLLYAPLPASVVEINQKAIATISVPGATTAPPAK